MLMTTENIDTGANNNDSGDNRSTKVKYSFVYRYSLLGSLRNATVFQYKTGIHSSFMLMCYLCIKCIIPQPFIILLQLCLGFTCFHCLYRMWIRRDHDTGSVAHTTSSLTDNMQLYVTRILQLLNLVAESMLNECIIILGPFVSFKALMQNAMSSWWISWVYMSDFHSSLKLAVTKITGVMLS